MRELRKIINRKGRLCLLSCGHQQTSRGRVSAYCKQCEEEGRHLVYSGEVAYTYLTTETNHEECMIRLSMKCRWEHMSRLGVLINWPGIVCEKCRQEIDLYEVKQ